MPLSKIFAQAGKDPNLPGPYQIEHLFFDEVGTTSNTPFKAPFLTTLDSAKDIKQGKINEYQFVDMSGSDNTNQLVTRPVHSYDFKNKTFSINMANSNINILEEKIKRLYIDKKLLTTGGSHPLLTLNKDKTDNKRINPSYSVRSDTNAINTQGLGKLLFTSLYLNQCLVFQVDGSTMRRSGRFVGIDRLSFSDNNLDYKLCGQWFVTSVKHNFFHNMYNNEVTAIKIHSYKNLNIKKDV
jgi:hypothetical protein